MHTTAWRRVGATVAAAACLVLSACDAVVAQDSSAQSPPSVSVVAAVQRSVPPRELFSTRLEATQTVELRPQVGGTLQKVHFREGQTVRKGELLFTLDARPLQAEVARVRAQRETSRTQGELARAELARAEKLLPIQAASQQEIDQLRAAVRNADAGSAAAQAALDAAQLNLDYTRISAPMDGRMSRAEVTAGNLVAPGSTLLSTLVASDQVLAYVEVSEAAYLRFVRAARATGQPVQVQMGLADEPGLPHAGRIDFIDNRLNPATGTIRARARFENKGGLLTPGLSVRVQITGPAGAPETLVPERAIGTDQTRKTVLVVGADNIVQVREVQPGLLIDGMRVVGGVRAGERVIVDGLQRAFPGAPVSPQVLATDAAGMPLPASAGAPGAARK
jgi:RND family efflux transporter MFP subunit